MHQLRGRVGRGTAESVCILLYQAPLSPTAKQRLQTMRADAQRLIDTGATSLEEVLRVTRD